jgi:pimeloyl-ACP methyl ester carboxylesterase
LWTVPASTATEPPRSGPRLAPAAPGHRDEPGPADPPRGGRPRHRGGGREPRQGHRRPAQPVLIGHSFGGLLAEKLLGQDIGVAAIAIDAAPIKGVLPLPLSSLRVTLPVFKNRANKHKAVSLTSDQFHYGFGNALDRAESDELFDRWSIPSPGRPLCEAAAANFSPHSPAAVHTDNEQRGPLLLIMGGQDHTVPEAITKSTLKQYRHSSAETDLVEFADRGHSLVVDHGWREVADACLTWLRGHDL